MFLMQDLYQNRLDLTGSFMVKEHVVNKHLLIIGYTLPTQVRSLVQREK